MMELETEQVERVSTIHPSEAAAPSPAVIATPLQALLTGHILTDGELVLLLLKPSPWFIIFSSLKFSAAVIICAIGLKLSPQEKIHIGGITQTATLLICGRVMWSTLQWMGRYYILTDLRILRIGGVFRVEIFACTLRKVARTRVLRTVKDHLVNVGQIEIIPQDEQAAIGVWQCVARPRVIQEQIIAAIRRARHTGRGSGG